MIRDRAELETAWRGGARPTLLFFWGHRAAKDGRITPSCFSQWWPAVFEIDGQTYPSAEHWMMASKARLFGDAETEGEILAAAGPSEAKALGRKVRGFDPALWDAKKFEIVVEGSFEKFARNRPLADHLQSTGDAVLVEASPVDPIWGIGLAADDPRAQDPHNWRGENLLGFALMIARERLRTTGAR